MPTKNIGLHTYSTSETAAQWCDALNSDNEKVDGLVNVVESGSNSQLSYQKYSDGTVHMWGRIDYGTQYPCHIEWAGAAGWASDDVVVTFPVALADASYSLIPYVRTDKNPDMWVVSNHAQELSRFRFCFLCAINDSTSETGVNNKTVNLDIWGRWR